MLKLLFHTLFLIGGMLLIVFGSIALCVYVYCKCSRKPFTDVFPIATEKCIRWIINELNLAENGSQSVFPMAKEWISPIHKALNENGISCIEKTAYVCLNVAYYEFTLADKVKEIDVGYLEQLIQSVFYNEILPLYQTEPIQKVQISVFVRKQEQILFIYVGHCPQAYAKINEYRNIEQQRKLEALNSADKEMIE